jgi:hypothetical protein
METRFRPVPYAQCGTAPYMAARGGRRHRCPSDNQNPPQTGPLLGHVGVHKDLLLTFACLSFPGSCCARRHTAGETAEWGHQFLSCQSRPGAKPH